MPSPLVSLILFTFLGSPLGGLFVWRRDRLGDTTLLAPAIWGLISCISLVLADLVSGMDGAPESFTAAVRYAAAMGTFCPMVALLGAKRPQDRGWQWIVFSLWAILCQPAGEWLLFGGVAEIHPARFWFLMILIAVGATNGLGTRYWPSTLLYGVSQVLLLLPYVSSTPPLSGPQASLWGTAGILVSWLLPTLGIMPARRAASRLDRVWLDFRDAFGVVWALRIAERMNASARMYDWPLELTWQGFIRKPDRDDPAPAALEESFRTLLRRFVSPAWIDDRLGHQNEIPRS